MNFHLRKADGSIYGPIDKETLDRWLEEGRIAEDDFLSNDGENWAPVSVENEPAESWSDAAKRNDFYQKEAARWKALRESERTYALQVQEDLNENIKQLTADAIALRKENEKLKHRLMLLDTNYRTLKESAIKPGNAGGVEPAAVQHANLMESYQDLVMSYDALLRQVEEKSEEVESAHRFREDTEQHMAELRKSLEAQTARAQQEAMDARERLVELEQAHQQLQRAYRDMNERYIKLRQKTDQP